MALTRKLEGHTRLVAVARPPNRAPLNNVEESQKKTLTREKILGEVEKMEEEKEWPARKIRETFVSYFGENGHTHWPSSSVVPHEDPTLLFANAGMNQYKSIFLGTIDPSAPMAKLKRACNSQKCIRAGGKHNDLDDVGKDTYHHTFFEMLGNWSFGDYFKEEAIKLAWECLTVAYGLDPDRLYATYFGGDEKKAPGVPSDEETRQIWLKYLPEERVLPFDAADNFWEMGDSGPCGPCTEIHYDRVGSRDASKLVNMDDPMVIEIWNNVFIQYNRDSTGLKPLPSQHVDTGMGFERLASILQGKTSNYDTDIFTPLFSAIQKETGSRGYVGEILEDEIDVAYRVVADHIRTLSFAIADGAVPDSVGRGYVLRRVLRRAVWYGQHFLKAPKEFLFKLVPALVENMGDAFPELRRSQDTVVAVLRGEERDFNRTIDKGARFFEKKISPSGVFDGKDAFHLAGSLGFPLDLTEIMAAERGMTVDVAGYEAALAHDKKMNEEALAKRKEKRAGAADLTLGAEQTSALSQFADKTASEKKYTHEAISTTIVAVFAGRGKGEKGDGFVSSIQPDEFCGLVLADTSFYAEMGGQAADVGFLSEPDDSDKVFDVEDVQVFAGYVVHSGVASKSLKVGDAVVCHVDYDRRSRIAPNHTMTHVLNFALRDVLLGGKNDDLKCAQRGSFVDDERLRFDFAWDAPLAKDDLASVEKIVRDQIKECLPVDCVETPLADALAVDSLRSMKGENYPDPVRVVCVGAHVSDVVAAPKDEAWMSRSVELCGGTHLMNTKEAVDFAILSEEGISKGVRRIVAVTKEKAATARASATTVRETIVAFQQRDVDETFDKDLKAFKVSLDKTVLPASDKIAARADIEQLVNGKLKAAQKIVAEAKAAAAAGDFEKLSIEAATSKKVATRIDIGDDSKLFAKLQKSKLSKGAPDASYLVVSKIDDESFAIFATVSSTHRDSLSACDWGKAAAEASGGVAKGGGKAASAKFTVKGGTIDLALSTATDYIK